MARPPDGGRRRVLGQNARIVTPFDSNMFGWLSTKESERFGKELAGFLLTELSGSMEKSEAKFSAKAEKSLLRADQRLQEFKARERMNVFKKAKLANAFLWALKDAGIPQDYANKLTDWLSVRL